MAPRRPRKANILKNIVNNTIWNGFRGGLGRISEALGGVLEACGAVMEALGSVLEALERSLEALEVVLEAILGPDSSKQAQESENLEKHKEKKVSGAPARVSWKYLGGAWGSLGGS